MKTKGLLVAIFLFVVLGVTGVFASVGDYKETACTASYFTANNCSACFEGTTLANGDQINGLYDSWTNKNDNEQIIYKNEQTMPEIVSLSPGTIFVANPSDPNIFWKYGNQVMWISSQTATGQQEFQLDATKSIKFLEADLGASYTLSSTDKASGEVIGVVKFPLSYHNVDKDGVEGKKETHIECVSYALKNTPAVALPVEVITPEPQPTQMTTVKAGPDSLLLLALALLIAAGFVIMKNRKTH